MNGNHVGEIANVEKWVEELYKTWRSVREETVIHLGKEIAFHIMDFHASNWIEITTWVSQKYTHSEQTNMVFLEFQRLFKEIYWLQFLFLNANYPMIYRNLRYMLEMMAQAYYIDWEFPDLTVDQQYAKMIEIEDMIFGWKFVRRVLSQILDSDENYIEERFHHRWSSLNQHVHPSAKQMGIIVRADPASLVTDSFNADFAREALAVIDEIFDLVYVLIFRKFPKINEPATHYKLIDRWEKHLPNTIHFLSPIS